MISTNSSIFSINSGESTEIATLASRTKVGVGRLLSAALILGVITLTACGAPAGSTEDVDTHTENLQLGPGKIFRTTDQPLWSDGGAYYLSMQQDCNLVLYDYWSDFVHPKAVWNSGTWNRGVDCYAWMQTDGNFVIYNGNNQALWQSGTWGHLNKGVYLQVQSDRNVVIYLPDPPPSNIVTPLWSTRTTR